MKNRIFTPMLCALFGVLTTAQVLAQVDFCTDFDNNQPTGTTTVLGNWIAVAASMQYANNGQDGAGDIFLQGNDASGGSFIFNATDYQGNWAGAGDNCLCFDIIIINNGTGLPNRPSTLQIFQGASPTSATFRAVFEAANAQQQGDGWKTICPPIGLADAAGNLPSNADGAWRMVVGTNADWNALISNVSGIMFGLDIPGGGPTEVYGYDNICIEPCPTGTSCEYSADCLTRTLNVGTGVNHGAGALYNPGDGDAYWQLISVPTSAGAITVPRPAFVIPSEPISGFNNVWAETANSWWISGQPINNWNTNGGPYVFERCFCVCEPGEYNLDFRVWVDDRVDIGLYSGSTLVTPIGSATGFAFNSPGTHLTRNVNLMPGTYCIRADLYNTGSTAMGLNIEGFVTGQGLVSTFCCNTASSIVGVKYNDLNANGTRDTGEPALSGWTIQLTDGSTTLSSTTDASGYYSFTGIAPGTYTLSEVLQPGWTPTLPTAGIVANLGIAAGQSLIINFGNVERTNCEDEFDVAFTPLRVRESDNCCYSINYANSGSQAVHALVVEALDGVTLHYNNLQAGYTEQHTPSTLTVVPSGLGPFPTSVNNLLELCLGHVRAMPQIVVIHYQDSNYETFCTDTLRFACPPEAACLYILSDSLACDSLGYKYTATVKNPIGSDFPVGLIKFNIDPPLPSGVMTNPDPLRFIISPPLQPGESANIMFTIETNGQDLYGDSLCFVLSAHDDERERLCCAEIDTCIAFPLCDPCILVDAEAVPIFPNQRDSCCYEMLITNQYPTPNYFTNVQTTIITPGVQFSSVTYPFIGGWIGVDQSSGGRTDYLWSHTSGAVPNVSSYNLFDFCIEGSTTTDSVYIAVNWLVGDSIVCTDTVGVFCPECLEIGETDLNCLPDGSYVYTIFNMVNNSPFSVNAVGLVETSPIDTILNAGVYPVPLTPPNGTISVPVYVWIADGLSEACFDIVLRFVDDSTGVNFTCCYATHCIELPPCDSLSTTPCPDPGQISQDPCPQVFDPVCGCDGQEYPNACVAENNGVLVYENRSCTDSLGTPPIVQISLSASERVGGGADLTWRPIWPELMHSYFVQRRLTGGDYQTIAVVSAAGVMAEESFMDVNPGRGFNEYRVLGITRQGYTRYSNEDDLFVQWDQSGQINVTVFPVPARNEIFVASSKQGECTLDVVSTDGRVFSSRPVRFDGMPVSVNIDSLTEGVFFVRLNYNDGETTQQRFVKVR